MPVSLQRVILSLKRFLDTILETLVIASMAVLVLDVVWQVFTRFVLRHPSSWTEEFATFLMMWVGLLGAAVALDRGAHLGVDFLTLKLPPRIKAGVEVAVYLLIIWFAVSVMIQGGIELVHKTLTTNQISPALGLKMGYVYLCLPISGFFISFYSILIAAGRSVALLARAPEVPK